MKPVTALLIIGTLTAAVVITAQRAPTPATVYTSSPAPVAGASPSPPESSTGTEVSGEGISGEGPAPVPIPSVDGSDVHGGDTFIPDAVTLEALAQTAERFVAGWLSTETHDRRRQLEGVAAEALVEQLTVPRIRTWDTSPAGSVVVVQIQADAAQLRQQFADGRAVELLAIPDPLAGDFGWIISDIHNVA